MNIVTATMIAKETNKGFTTPYLQSHRIVIEPTDTESCCIVHRDGIMISPRWNPRAEDLLRDDYVVVGLVNE